ncbi:MAG: DUF1653 domain-containing protein, partial [Hydrogenophaga sp.]|nr:DUF1653 domain-containing protein [Hydrogenophaga sp.]
MRYAAFGVFFSSVSLFLGGMQDGVIPDTEKRELVGESKASTQEGPMEEQKIEQCIVDVEVTPGIYEHFKNKSHRYEVVGVARYSEDPHQEFVVYKSLYESKLEPEGKVLPSGTLWVRPKKMFIE